MKRIFYAVVTCIMLPLFGLAQNYSELLAKHRQDIKNRFENDPYGPIRKENTSYLAYFPANQEYLIEAKVKFLSFEKPFRMPTYDGTSNEYKRYAQLEFILNGETITLTAYQSVSLLQNPKYKDYLFLPFLDETNGTETYGGGRYLELDASKIRNHKIIIDFNKSYNPYCAYSTGYRCPQPPSENTIYQKVLAGEKKYNGPKNDRQVNKNMALGFTEKEREIILQGDKESKLHVYQTTDEKELEILRTPSQDIKLDDPLLEVLERRMYLTVQDPEHAGVGIAAPQIGINKNLIWVQRYDKPNAPFEFFINPKIIWRSKLTRLGAEGCLSIPDRRENVKRSYAIRLQYWDKKGNIIEENIEGFTAVIFQHEVDHLYGILYPDRLEDQKDELELSDKIKFSIEKGNTKP